MPSKEISGIPGFELCPGLEFQEKQFRDLGAVKKIPNIGIHLTSRISDKIRRDLGFCYSREVKHVKERTLNNIDDEIHTVKL